MSIPTQYAARVLKKENDLTTNIFDDDEWIRSLTEAQAITADIPEERIARDQGEVDPKKVRPVQLGGGCFC